jgi:hypothetical protein
VNQVTEAVGCEGITIRAAASRQGSRAVRCMIVLCAALPRCRGCCKIVRVWPRMRQTGCVVMPACGALGIKSAGVAFLLWNGCEFRLCATILHWLRSLMLRHRRPPPHIGSGTGSPLSSHLRDWPTVSSLLPASTQGWRSGSNGSRLAQLAAPHVLQASGRSCSGWVLVLLVWWRSAMPEHQASRSWRARAIVIPS